MNYDTNILPYIHAEEGQGGEGDDKSKVAFNDDQKARINEIFRERHAEIQEKHRQEVEAIKKEMKDELDSKLAEIAAKKKGGDGEGGDEASAEFKRILEDHKKQAENEKAARLKAEAVLKEKDGEMLSLRKEQAIRTAFTGLNFAKPEQVLALTGSSVEWDKSANRFVVRNDDGDIVQGDDLKPIALSDYYAKWAEENPHFVKIDARGGAGSTGSNAGSGSAGEFADIKTKADLKGNIPLRVKYVQKYGLKKYEELPLK